MGAPTPRSARKTAPEPGEAPIHGDQQLSSLRRQRTMSRVGSVVATSVDRRLTRTLMKSVSTNWAVEEYIARRRTAGQLTRLDMTYRALASPGSSCQRLRVTRADARRASRRQATDVSARHRQAARYVY